MWWRDATTPQHRSLLLAHSGGSPATVCHRHGHNLPGVRRVAYQKLQRR